MFLAVSSDGLPVPGQGMLFGPARRLRREYQRVVEEREPDCLVVQAGKRVLSGFGAATARSAPGTSADDSRCARALQVGAY
jgi:hypothetical protein